MHINDMTLIIGVSDFYLLLQEVVWDQLSHKDICYLFSSIRHKRSVSARVSME